MSAMRRVEPLRAWDDGGATVILSKGRTLRYEGDSGTLAREVLAILGRPTSRNALLGELGARAGHGLDTEATAVIDALLHKLRLHGVITEAPAPQWVRAHRRRVLLGVCGAVAAVDAPALARLLLARGHEVRVVLTRSARRFVSARALEAITHAPVHRSLWQGAPREPAPHIALARWAELVAVYPCTASTLSRLAAGDASDLLSATVCATRARVIVAPSMNHEMLASEGVQENLERLRARGVLLAHSAVGVEVADAPRERGDMLGPAMPPEAFVSVLDELLAALPPPPPSWDHHYLFGLPRPWEVEADADLDAVLTTHAPPSTHPRLIEAGCGRGLHARARSREGYAVTATDVSDAAIERASECDDRITWVCDDVTRSRLHGRFDALVDRGCLHVLDDEGRAAYVEQAARWLRVGGVWALKVHAEECEDCGTTRFNEVTLDAQLGASFERIALGRCEFGGVPGRPALVAAYRRR